MTEMEIPQAAIEAAEQAMRGHDCHDLVNANIPHLARVGLAAALPHLTLTASEVKVLTETASKVAYALGRKDAGEEIAEALEALADAIGDGEQREFLIDFADTARDIASQAFQTTSDATSGVPGHREVSEAARSPQEPCGHPTCPCASQEAR